MPGLAISNSLIFIGSARACWLSYACSFPFKKV